MSFKFLIFIFNLITLCTVSCQDRAPEGPAGEGPEKEYILRQLAGLLLGEVIQGPNQASLT